MAEKFAVMLTHAKDDPDKASVALVVARTATASGKETLIFLTSEGVRLGQRGYAEGIHEPGFSPLAGELAAFIAGGGKVYLCKTCVLARGMDEGNLIAGVAVVGSATFVEFLSGGTPCVSF
ncbi:MAG: DsrE family protein [Pirellulales bacterium]